MTILTDSDFSKIASNQFGLDFVRAKLTQQGSDAPRLYEGPGSLTQDERGALQLKLYCGASGDQDLAAEMVADFNRQDLTPGQLLGQDYYYLFEGVDLYGRIWSANNVAINVTTGMSSGGQIVRAKRLRRIKNCSESAFGGSDRIVMVVPGTFRVPFTGSQPQEAGFSICNIDLGGSTAVLKTKAGTLVVEVALTGQDLLLFPQRVLEAVGVAIGARLRPQVEVTLAGGERTQVIRSLEDEAHRSHRLQSPMPTRGPGDFSDFQALVVNFLAAFDKPYDQLAGYWFRALSAFSDSLENQALVLTTAIEGVLKTYFSEDTKPDAEYVAQISAAKPLVKALPLGVRARERLLGSLGNAKDPTATNALHALEKNQRIPEGLREVWKELRNKMSHADELQWDDAKTQLFINDLYGCLELFYRLLMLHIGYEGRLICYSKVGWPTEQVGTYKDSTAIFAANQ